MGHKQSKYNYFIDYKGKILLFNGLSGAGFCMSPSEYQQLLPLFRDLSSFQKKYPDDFKRLLNLGYITDTRHDELGYIKYMNKAITFNNQCCTLTINPTINCNFNCWYCYEDHHYSKMSEEVMDSIRRYTEKVVLEERIQSFVLSWFGGEPLLYFWEIVYPLSLYIKNFCESNNVTFKNGITTNGYCIDPDIAKAMAEINLSLFQITLDGNRERHNTIRNIDGMPTYDTIVKNIKTICENISNSDIALRINYDNATLNYDLREIVNEFPEDYRSHIRFDLHRVWQTEAPKGDKTIDGKIQQFIDIARLEGYNCACVGGLFPKKFYNCYVCRTDFKLINYDGNVFKCTARDFSEENAIGKLNNDGVIEWDNHKLAALYGRSPLETKRCQECKHLPLCMGPCPQHFLEHSYDPVNCCTLNSIEDRTINDLIIDLYENALNK